uniref:Uncharacterized protein n=1 Tax=Sphenodon punctatus TaxID=8508 RepID=A0A8D0GLR3_SPHPU
MEKMTGTRVTMYCSTGPLSRDGSFGPSPVSGGAPSPPLMMDGPVRPPSANRREASRGEFGAVVDGPPAPRRPSEMSGRMSVPDLSPAVAALANSGPRTSSPSAVMDGMVNLGPRGPPSFPGTPIMTSPATGPPLPPVRFGLPPPPLRGHYGPRPLPFSLVRGPPPPPISRDYPPGPPPGVRDLPPGALPAPEQRGYMRGPPPFRPLGPRDYPPGPRLPPSVLRDYPPPPANRDLPLSGPRDYPAGPPCPPSSASSKDSAHPPEQKP